VELQNGGSITVVLEPADLQLPGGLTASNLDNRILMVAFDQQRNHTNVCFVTKDLNARVKADALGVYSEDFETNKVNIDELFAGWRAFAATDEELADFEEHGSFEPAADSKLLANEFVILKQGRDLESSILGRFDGTHRRVLRLNGQEYGPWGIEPLNAQQLFALDVLLDDRINLVTLVGQAGTGKTLLCLAAGLQKTIDERVFRRMLVSRPIMPMGRDIGYLPGSKDEKITHWMQPIFDNLEFIFTGYLEGEMKADEQLKFLLDSKKIELEALTYIRGRSIPNQYLVVDEAQNLTPHEVKTIITRAGEGTKIVLTGDPYQIDNPYLDASSNGLAYVVERFKGHDLYGHVTLVESERSPLSSLAVELL
jgi:PhoH-like ATPase